MMTDATDSGQGETMRLETPDDHDGPARFSRSQKRELLELTAAGVLSAIFVASPIFVTIQPARSGVTPPPATTVAQASPSGFVSAAVQVRTTDVTAAVSAPALQAAPAVLRTLRSSPAPRRRASAVAALHMRVPLGRRIARLFAGDGSHTVQPFPTVPATER
jgi:hypothetical protein